jgi:hypothetical protein
LRLTREQIDKIAALVLKDLEAKRLVEYKVGRDEVYRVIVEVITADLKAEDDLDREVETLIESHAGRMESGSVDQRKVFGMIKGKLARERGIVL